MDEQNKQEMLGVDTIPETQRNANPNSLFPIFIGSNLSLSVMVFGWLAILYGLSWWQATSAILIGTFVAALFISFSSLLGFRTATNNSVSSGAFFGVKGRLIASFVGLLLCLQYVALTIWSGGETISTGWARITKTQASDLVTVFGYLIIAAFVIFLAIYGYGLIIKVNRLIVPAMIILMLLSILAFRSLFDFNYPGTPDLYALKSFWPTWLLAAITCGAAGPISYVTQTGDWTRYISETNISSNSLVKKTFWALFIGLSIPTLFGAFIGVVAFDENSFSAGYVTNAPTWLLTPLLLIAIIGSLGQGSINLYSMGLDLDAILPKLSRPQSTYLVAGFSTALVFLGKFVFDAESAVTNSVLFLTCMATAWFSITIFGYFRISGRFEKDSLQIFNRGTTGGIYWFKNGWNSNAILAWLFGTLVGFLGVSTTDFQGPISKILHEIDLSIPLSAMGALLLFIALEKFNPKVL
jgi:purine-cytosine permease-like protein